MICDGKNIPVVIMNVHDKDISMICDGKNIPVVIINVLPPCQSVRKATSWSKGTWVEEEMFNPGPLCRTRISDPVRLCVMNCLVNAAVSEWSPTRVAKCHRYGRYICVKILEGLGKKCWRQRSFVKWISFGVTFTNLDEVLSLNQLIWIFSLFPQQYLLQWPLTSISFRLGVKFVAI